MKQTANNAVRYWLWPIVIALLGALLVIWLFAPSDDPSQESRTNRAPNSEWTTAPEGPAVQVDLPEAPIRRVPAQQADSSPAPSSEE